jgi:hypothetical protein
MPHFTFMMSPFFHDKKDDIFYFYFITFNDKALDTLEDPPILEDLPIIEDPHWKNNAKDILEDPSRR